LILTMVLAILTLFVTAQRSYAEEKAAPALDIILVLDNSGSMKGNDPEFLTKTVVLNFIEGLSSDSWIGFVIFAEKPELAMPLALVTDVETRGKVTRVMDKVNYRGKFTNIPAAIERAIYELKKNGRRDAEQLIIFMTDGIIDTGDRAMDIEKHRWLKDELAAEAKGAGIRIFGIAFTDQADFELIQTLGQKTDGGYYRALKVENIQGIFHNINETILKPRPKPESPMQSPIKVVVQGEGKGISRELLVVAVVGLILGIIALFFMRKAPKKVSTVEDIVIPKAELLDIGGVTGQASYKINKPVTVIGRREPEKRDKDMEIITIKKETISSLHAIIEYRDNNFCLIDRGSANGTYLNESIERKERIPGDVPKVLKSGDKIAFDEYRFEFRLAGQMSYGGRELKLKPGGTVLRPGPQGKSLDQETKVKPKSPEQKLESSSPFRSEEGGETVIKKSMCEKHPAFKVTELCPICKRGCCVNCLKEKNGRMICEKCFEDGKV